MWAWAILRCRAAVGNAVLHTAMLLPVVVKVSALTEFAGLFAISIALSLALSSRISASFVAAAFCSSLASCATASLVAACLSCFSCSRSFASLFRSFSTAQALGHSELLDDLTGIELGKQSHDAAGTATGRTWLRVLSTRCRHRRCSRPVVETDRSRRTSCGNGALPSCQIGRVPERAGIPPAALQSTRMPSPTPIPALSGSPQPSTSSIGASLGNRDLDRPVLGVMLRWCVPAGATPLELPHARTIVSAAVIAASRRLPICPPPGDRAARVLLYCLRLPPPGLHYQIPSLLGFTS